MINIVATKNVVETWNTNKLTGREFVQRDMRKFIEIMNDRTKALIHWMELRTVSEAQGIATQAADAVTLLNGDPMPEEKHHRTRYFVTTFDVTEPDFYTGLMELAVHACTLLTPKARIIADGIDRTNV